MAFTMPQPINGMMPRAVSSTFSNTATRPGAGLPHGKALSGARGGVRIAVKNPFQGAINKEALALRKY